MGIRKLFRTKTQNVTSPQTPAIVNTNNHTTYGFLCRLKRLLNGLDLTLPVPIEILLFEHLLEIVTETRLHLVRLVREAVVLGRNVLGFSQPCHCRVVAF